MSLIELLVASALTLVFLTVAYQFLNSSTSAAQAITTETQASDNARLAIAALEGDLRYATNVATCGGDQALASCAVGGSSTPTLVVETDPGGVNTCTTWTLASTGLDELQTTGGTYTSTGTTARPTAILVAGISGASNNFGTVGSASPTTSTTTTGTYSGAFTMASTTLVELDLTATVGGSSVSAHQLIAPDDLGSGDAAHENAAGCPGIPDGSGQ